MILRKDFFDELEMKQNIISFVSVSAIISWYGYYAYWLNKINDKIIKVYF